MNIFGRALSRPKVFRAGTHRTRSPEETLADYGRFMAAAGVTRLANVTGLDHVGLPVYVAVRPNARSLCVTQGKGIDAASAKASALMEALEVWHAERFAPPARVATYDALRRDALVVDLDAVAAQAGRPAAHDAPRRWVEGYDLLRGAPAWVPLELVSLDFAAPWDGAAAPLSSNGLASGNDLLEALVHGLCELIERDAVTLWFERDDDGKATQLDLATVRGGACEALLARLADAGLAVGAFDATSDVGIPCYQCVVADRPGAARPMGYFWGFGCHLAPEVAMMRALTEAVQCRLTEITGTRDDIDREAYALNRYPAELAGLVAALEDPAPTRAFGARASRATDTFEGDLAVLLDALRAAGVASAVAVDLTRPEVGVAVVKVVAPALEGAPFAHVPGPRARRAKESDR